jgi:hypothetical protein
MLTSPKEIAPVHSARAIVHFLPIVQELDRHVGTLPAGVLAALAEFYVGRAILFCADSTDG